MSASDPNERLRRAAQYRSAHRARSHESAHASANEAPADSPASDHPLIPRGDAPLVASSAALAELLSHLRACGSFAYDSEFIGELTYIPKLCVIQVATTQRVALIDPLAELDLKPFWELICDASVEKIIHAGQQDLEPAIRHLKRPALNLFDTQIVAGFAGMSYPASLFKLVHELTGARLGKGFTFTHWDQRPLSAVQLRYAADDVRYLPAVRAELGKRAGTLGHEEYAREECAALGDISLYQFDPNTNFLRIRGANSLPPSQQAILRELCILRDSSARQADLPPRSFLRDEILLDLARSPVKSVDKLSRVRGLPRPIELSHGEQIVQATLRALSIPSEQMPAPRQQEETATERFRVDSLWIAAQALAAGRGIDPNLLTSRQEISELYRRLASGQDPAGLRITAGWRLQCVGNALIDLFHGKVNADVQWTTTGLRVSTSAG